MLGQTITANAFQVNLNVRWEIDLWSRLRSVEEAARAQILSAEAAQQALLRYQQSIQGPSRRWKMPLWDTKRQKNRLG